METEQKTTATADNFRYIPPSETYKKGMKKLNGSGAKRRKPAEEKKPGRAQYILCFLVVLMTAGSSIGGEVLMALHISPNAITITLLAIVVSLMTAHRNMMLVVLVVGLSFAVNLPAEVLEGYGVDRTILLGTLMALLLEPVARRIIFGAKRTD
jgi:hypothetical protein